MTFGRFEKFDAIFMCGDTPLCCDKSQPQLLLLVCYPHMPMHGGLSASWAGNLPFWGTLLPQKPKIGRIGARRLDVGSACVDNRQSPSLAVLV